ncbi:hypothetical protein D3C86_1283740 [compost metagenome]
MPGATLNQRALRLGPQARAIIDVGQFVQHGGQHFPTHSAVGTIGFLGCGAAIRKAGQQVAVQIELRHRRCLTVGVGGHLIGPADVDAPVELLDEMRRQGLHGFIKQGLAGLLLRGAQAFGLEVEFKVGVGQVAEQQHDPGQQPGCWRPHSARMASARS